jgi:hypothetical protein
MKAEIKKAIFAMLQDDATVTDLCNTTEDFTWVFEHRKTNAEQFRACFETESHNTTGDYKSTFFVNGLHATIVT